MNIRIHAKKTAAVVIFLLFVTPCLAQDFVPSPSAEIDSTAPGPEVSPFPSIRKEFYYYDEAWFPFLVTLSERNKTDALRLLDSLEDAKYNYGDKNASFYSYALLALSRQQEKEGDIDTATKLIDESIKLSPDIPRLYFYRAAFMWRNEPGHLYDIVNYTVTGIKLSLRDITIETTLGANLALGVIIAILGVFALLSFSLAAKYTLLAANDIKERFGWDIPLLLFSAFMLVLFIFLFSLGIGLLWLVVLMNFAFLIYYTKSEKKIFALFYVLIILSPIMLNYTAALMLSTHRDVIDEIMQIKQDTYSLKAETALTRWVTDNPDDTCALFALASLNKRTGYLDYAQRYYGKIIETDPTCAPALNNLGAVYFIIRDYARAEEFFHKANDADPDLVGPYYNLYKLSMTRFDLKTAEEYYDMAMKLDPARITAFLDVEVKEDQLDPSFLARTNRVVIDEDIPDSFLWKRVFTMNEPKELAGGIFSSMMKGMGLRAVPVVGIVGLIFLMISGSLAQRNPLSKFCRFCGLPFLLKSQPHMERRDSCNRCFSVFVRKEGIDPKTKADLRIKVDRINYIRKIALIIANLIIPGFGRIYRGRALRGFVLLSLFVIFAVQLMYLRGIVVYPVKSLGLPLIHSPILFGVGCVIVYLVAQSDFIKSELSENK
jgi:tetratricopeptide (TPR) repeat protein/TM2 domain-containing membrane protein YozV